MIQVLATLKNEKTGKELMPFSLKTNVFQNAQSNTIESITLTYLNGPYFSMIKKGYLRY